MFRVCRGSAGARSSRSSINPSDKLVDRSSRDCPAGIFYLMSCRVWSARSPDRPVQHGGDREADTGRRRIDYKILQSRVPSRRPELQDFEQADPGDSHHRRKRSMPGIGCAECQPDQNERERMLAILTEAGVRPEPGRTQGGESDSSGQKPGEYSQDDDHEDGISRFIDRILRPVRICDARVVNAGRQVIMPPARRGPA